MLQKMYDTPSRSKWTVRLVPASYSPRSKRLPLNNENTLWNQGSRLGKSTVEPLVTTSRWGSNVLFLCCSMACMGATMAGSPGAAAIGASQTTVALAGDRLPPASATTRPDTLMSCDHKAGVAHSANATLNDSANFLAVGIVPFRTVSPSPCSTAQHRNCDRRPRRFATGGIPATIANRNAAGK